MGMTDATAPDSRTRVQIAIDTAGDSLSVEQIAERTGLHANTVRGHLDVLLAGGAITRTAADAQGRGRPRWLYASATPPASPFQFLAEALSAQLARTEDPSIAQGAAELWAHALPTLPVADTPDEAVDEATDALNRLGFQAVASPLRDSIAVTGCPYADLVDDNPVICDIHTALVVRLLDQTGQPVTVEAMDVWARRGMCVARLGRPDIEPARTITITARGAVSSAEGNAS